MYVNNNLQATPFVNSVFDCVFESVELFWKLEADIICLALMLSADDNIRDVEQTVVMFCFSVCDKRFPTWVL